MGDWMLISLKNNTPPPKKRKAALTVYLFPFSSVRLVGFSIIMVRPTSYYHQLKNGYTQEDSRPNEGEWRQSHHFSVPGAFSWKYQPLQQQQQPPQINPQPTPPATTLPTNTTPIYEITIYIQIYYYRLYTTILPIIYIYIKTFFDYRKKLPSFERLPDRPPPPPPRRRGGARRRDGGIRAALVVYCCLYVIALMPFLISTLLHLYL